MLGIDPATDTNAYSKVRLDWPTQGQPAWAISEDVVFLRIAEHDNEYTKIRDVEILARDAASVTQRFTYTRTWSVYWVLYGPNSFDRATILKSALLLDYAYDLLAASSLYATGTLGTTKRAPELFASQWWERSDLEIYLNEAITETTGINSIGSAEVILDTVRGVVADIKF